MVTGPAPAPPPAPGPGPDIAAAREIAEATPDPELGVVTAGDLGMVRSVTAAGAGVTVTLTPTYSGCPAIAAIAADVRRRLAAAGFGQAEVRLALAPAWSSDWITAEGRRKLAAAGISPPGPAPARGGARAAGHGAAGHGAAGHGAAGHGAGGPVPVDLLPAGAARPGSVPAGAVPVTCPRCGSARTERTAAFGATACKALYRCRGCGEPFEHVKEI
jgi:ring-1,2-phenylacetyl-CoA epoxidase subunit PaaD